MRFFKFFYENGYWLRTSLEMSWRGRGVVQRRGVWKISFSNPTRPSASIHYTFWGKQKNPPPAGWGVVAEEDGCDRAGFQRCRLRILGSGKLFKLKFLSTSCWKCPGEGVQHRGVWKMWFSNPTRPSASIHHTFWDKQKNPHLPGWGVVAAEDADCVCRKLKFSSTSKGSYQIIPRSHNFLSHLTESIHL